MNRATKNYIKRNIPSVLYHAWDVFTGMFVLGSLLLFKDNWIMLTVSGIVVLLWAIWFVLDLLTFSYMKDNKSDSFVVNKRRVRLVYQLFSFVFIVVVLIKYKTMN